jgi:hypothetical protein
MNRINLLPTLVAALIASIERGDIKLLDDAEIVSCLDDLEAVDMLSRVIIIGSPLPSPSVWNNLETLVKALEDYSPDLVGSELSDLPQKLNSDLLFHCFQPDPDIEFSLPPRHERWTKENRRDSRMNGISKKPFVKNFHRRHPVMRHK